ncbi:hypothetical protein CXG81DRAFT_25010 [Caulochytrium protostelioides]|uniref:DUF4470 domain-containing protein n=1 Tax=Caulochytrium protostelioides TaxID=1555241 RepID=A0A4P9XAF6_9FUNG|nr:hypothetical protein CXG81DRAFT_25010 [Caulochytrium protostelioides]|eukprot:RKP02316.1 hypothetical protein CXG81DRAFT_25010 [Caulochytrium protostelioides]
MPSGPALPGHGSAQPWGLSRAIDLQSPETWEKERPRDTATTGITELPPRSHDPGQAPHCSILVGTHDPRHVMMTLGRAAARLASPAPSPACLQFYIIETQTPQLARFLLMLSCFLAPLDPDASVHENMLMWLEIYGNLLLRPRTQALLDQRLTALRDALDDDRPRGSVAMASLKFRERDDVAASFAAWRSTPSPPRPPLAMPSLWDARCRAFYGVRYDARANLADWDFHMKVKPLSELIQKPPFLHYRATGQAFPVRDAQHTQANRTLAGVQHVAVDAAALAATSAGRDVLAQRRGGAAPDLAGGLKWGLWGDILASPYWAFAADTDVPARRETVNEQPRHTTAEIAAMALVDLYDALRHAGATWDAAAPLGSGGAAPGPSPSASTSGLTWQLHLLSIDPARQRKALPPAGSANAVVLGCDVADHAPAYADRLAPGGHLLIESAATLLELTAPQRGAYEELLRPLVLDAVSAVAAAGAPQAAQAAEQTAATAANDAATSPAAPNAAAVSWRHWGPFFMGCQRPRLGLGRDTDGADGVLPLAVANPPKSSPSDVATPLAADPAQA